MPRKPKTPFVNRVLSRRDKFESKVVDDLLLEIAEERDLLEVIFDSMMEGVIAADHEGRVIFYNSAAATLFDFEGELAPGCKVAELLPPGRLHDLITAGLETGERIYEAEVRIDTPLERILRVNVIPLIDRLERFFGTVILVIDVTERKAAEARLSLAEKLAARTTISAGIAHEVRNPLNSLSIHLQLAEKHWRELRKHWEALKARYPEASPPAGLDKIENNLSVIRDEVDRLDTVVKNFLLAVRPQRPNWAFVDVETLITNTLKVLEPEISSHQIDLVFEPLEEPLTLPVDEFQIHQVLINILRNSIDAMSGGGQIRIRLTKLADRIRIQILDTGEGIPSENLKRVFEPYFTTRAEGTGLGLAVVERIIREHQGRLRVESDPKQGTCFTIDLPLSTEHSKQIPILEDENKGE